MYDTKMEKTKAGWTALTEVDMGEAMDRLKQETGRRVCKLETRKNSFNGAIVARARVVLRTRMAETHAMSFGLDKGADFSKEVHVVYPPRATEKAIKEAHQAALTHFPAVLEQAKNHYIA